MALTSPSSDVLKTLDSYIHECELRLAECRDDSMIADVKAEFLGTKGTVTLLMKGLKALSIDDRKLIGSKANEVKNLLEERIKTRLGEIRQAEIRAAVESSWIDPTLRESNLELGLRSGGLHPLTIVQREAADVFYGMGFEILDGPHVETDYYNFEALNIPSDHPARDRQDTFWFPDLRHLLRTHTRRIVAM